MEILRKTATFKLTQQTTNDSGAAVPVEEVTELHFTQLPLVLPSQLAPFHCLRKLSLVSLKPTLKRFWDVPVYLFPVLEKLDLSDNKVSGICSASDSPGDIRTAVANEAQASWSATSSAHKLATALPISTLKRLHLANNDITDAVQLHALAVVFPNLEVLDIADNPVAAGTSTANDVFSLWPTTLEAFVAVEAVDREGKVVEVLDTDDDEEESDDDEEGDEEEDEDDSGSEDTHEPATKMARIE